MRTVAECVFTCDTKRCKVCGLEKPIQEFYMQLDATKKRRYAKAQCKLCDNARRAKHYEEHREEARWQAVFKKYGLTQQSWSKLFESQGSCCAVCRSESPNWGRGWLIDHCHTSGKIRGVVCTNCNLLIGHAQDNISILEATIKYLLRHP